MTPDPNANQKPYSEPAVKSVGKTYAEPELIHYGSLAKVTQKDGQPAFIDNAGMSEGQNS